MFGGSENIQYSKLTVGADTSKLSVLDLVSHDLNVYLDQGNDRQKRLNFLSKKLEIHKKTLQRISVKENKPSYATIIKLYRFLFNVDSDQKVLEMVPKVIREFLQKSFPEKMIDNSNYNENSLRIFNENPVAFEIYLLAAIKGVSSVDLKNKYGEYGLNIVKKLVTEKLVVEATPEFYSEGQRKFTYSPEMVIQAGKICVQAFAKPSSGYQVDKHFAGFYYEKLTPEAYLEWMQIDRQAMQKKIELAQRKESVGSIPVFGFSIVETLLAEEEL